MIKNSFALFLLCLAVNLGHAQEEIQVGKIYTVDSKVLGEPRQVWVGLPAQYDSTRRYPTIYVLDAEWQFDITLSVVKELAANDKVPAHIVIGIPHLNTEHRLYDMTFTSSEIGSDGKPDPRVAQVFSEEKTGGGLVFFTHLKDEVVPFVESTFLTNGFDVFIGHSLSGYFGAYTLTMESPFNAFQLYDPSIWYNRGEAINQVAESAMANGHSSIFIATAAGGKDRQQYNIDAHLRLHEILKEKGQISQQKIYSEEDHGSVRLPSLIDGLSDLYQGYSIGYILPTDTITAEDAEAHYERFSRKVNYRFACPPDAYRWIGFANHHQGNWQEAITAYDRCIHRYNDDKYVLLELAECYHETKQMKRSLRTYKRVLTLDSANETAKNKVEELEKLTQKE